MKIILGSSSKGRQAVLRNAGYSFEVMKPEINEKAICIEGVCRENSDPSQLVLKIALAKAEALLAKVNEPALLITCDQVVHHQNKIREKPINNDECYLYLNSYQQEPATTVSAIVVTNTVTKKQVSGVDIAKQWFLPIPTDIVDAVIAKGDVHYCAGGFMIDEPLLMNYLGKREGTEDSIIGLPLHLLKQLLETAQQE